MKIYRKIYNDLKNSLNIDFCCDSINNKLEIREKWISQKIFVFGQSSAFYKPLQTITL